MLHSNHRHSRAMVYVVLLLAGVATYTPLNITFYQSVALRIIGLFLITGATISLIGHVKKENRIEIIGSPLLVTALAALTASALIAHGEGDPTRYLTAMLLGAFSCSLFSRYRDLQSLISMGDYMKESE